MIGKTSDQNQKNIFRPLLKEFINLDHPLVTLTERIPWNELEKEFSDLYSHTGTPSKPIRLMAGLLILKQIYNLGDETLMPEWVRDPYFQYFCGEAEFQWKFPCDPSDLVHFRKRIGEKGVEKIFAVSVQLQGKDIKGKDVIVDTTAQEKNITFLTDSKLYRKVIEKCNTIAEKEGIDLRQNYHWTIKKLLLQLRFSHHPKRKKQARKALKKLRVIAGRQIRDIERKLSAEKLEQYATDIELFKQVISQHRYSKNNVYSLHEPHTSCIAKGKAHKEYEFGCKTSFAMLPKSNIIVGVQTFTGNPHDSKTLEPTLDQCKRINGLTFKRVILDRGYRGITHVGDTIALIPGKIKAKTTWQKQWYRKKFRSRSAIEPIIGHLKTDCRMMRNYLKGTQGDQINALMAAAALNFRRLLRKYESDFIFYFFQSFQILFPKQVIRYFGLKISC
ncbi:MAG: IS5 family transposase [Bacteroidales bacterium]|jgi:IS5 family transposase